MSSSAWGAIKLPGLKPPHNTILFPGHADEITRARCNREPNTIVANLRIIHDERPRAGIVDAIRVAMIEVDAEVVVTPGVFADVPFLRVLPQVARCEHGDRRRRGVAEAGDAG